MVNRNPTPPPRRRRPEEQCAPGCKDELAPICGSDCHNTAATTIAAKSFETDDKLPELEDDDTQELVIIGAGPHALTLLLRLLEPEADLLSDDVRHRRSLNKKHMRPLSEVRKHIQKVARGTVYKASSSNKKSNYSENNPVPPPWSLALVRSKVTVLDAHSNRWMSNWDENFDNIQIRSLRSPSSAHADPYDFRALDFYAEYHKRESSDLVMLPHLQRATQFRGPYQAPSTALFREFHQALAKGYGIDDMVQQELVETIEALQYGSNDAIFHVRTSSGRTIRTKRVVCAMGPRFRPRIPAWESSLRQELRTDFPSDKILHTKQVIAWLQEQRKQQTSNCGRLLIVGGGITSAQLALAALKHYSKVTLLQRSKVRSRQFDLEPKWMGPCRGKLQQHFASLTPELRACGLQDARQGGSIPPELVEELQRQSRLEWKQEAEIYSVDYDSEELWVSFADESEDQVYDQIWLATGSDVDLEEYPPLLQLHQTSLPIPLVRGLPVLSNELTWGTKKEDEEGWKRVARRNLYCMGVLAGLELGPDALNLLGARRGASRVAHRLRQDLSFLKK